LRAAGRSRRDRAAVGVPDSARAARREVRSGLQREMLGGARLFLLPNPSGRNAHVSYVEMLGAFRTLREYLEMHAPADSGGRDAERDRGGEALREPPAPATLPAGGLRAALPGGPRRARGAQRDRLSLTARPAEPRGGPRPRQ